MEQIAFYTQAYNSEKYIQKCIESILSQTFTDFKYYLVDNGSTDKTWEIIKKYARKDSRIVPIHVEVNTRGLLEKYIPLMYNNQHKYFSMLDSDDWLEPTYAEILLDFAENNNLDIAVGASCFHYEQTNQLGYRKNENSIIIDKNEIQIYFDQIYKFFRTIWGKIFKMSIINKIDYTDIHQIIQFGGYGADTIFSINGLALTNKIGIYNKVLHNYRVHNQSLSSVYNPNRFYTDILLYYKGENLLQNLGNVKYKNYIFIFLVYMNAIRDTINVILNSEINMYKKLMEIQKIISEPLTQQMMIVLVNNGMLEEFRKSILKMLLYIANQNIQNKEIIDLVYNNICLLNKNIDGFIIRKNILQHIQNNDFILSIINLDTKEILKKTLLSLDNEVFINIEWRILKGCFKENILLSWIDNKDFVLQYSNIICDIYINNLWYALEKIIEVLTNIDENPFQEEIVFMCLNVSAILENEEIFVYAKKIQTQLFIKNRKKEDAMMALNDLLEMCPNDKDIIKLKEYMEGKNV